ncbi:MAG TPA: cytochrome C oxidase subunit IV family protein [Polyangiaceae bacterium]|nr:cytochrome C oxidase subunit IV family protein [Polyangiaceae bacterium]
MATDPTAVPRHPDDPHTHDPEAHAIAHHVDPLWLYLAVFGALIVLTVVTVAASYVDFGRANTVIAVLIATTKALFVAVYFMHLRHDRRFNALVFVSGLFFLSFLFLFTLADTSTRNDVDDYHGKSTAEPQAAPTSQPSASPASH